MNDSRIDGAGSPDQSEGRDDRDLALRDLAEILLRRWRIVASSTALALLAGIVIGSRRTVTYTADLVLRIRSPRTGVEALGLPSALSDQPEVATSELEVLRSTTVLDRVVDSLGLRMVQVNGWARAGAPAIEAVQVGSDARPGRYALTVSASRVSLVDSSGRPIVEGARPGEWAQGLGFRILIGPLGKEGVFRFAVVSHQAAAERLQAALVVSQIRGTSLVRLRYTAGNPSLAAGVLNVTAEAYRENSIARAREESHRRREFIALQLVSLSDSLQAAQGALQSYQERTSTLDPQIQAQTLTQDLMQAGNELREAKFRQAVLLDILASLRSDTLASEAMERMGVLNQDVMPSGAAEYQQLRDLLMQRRRLTGSRFGMTSQGPSVEVLDSLIALAKRNVRAAAEQSLALASKSRQDAEQHVSDLTARLALLPSVSAVFSRLSQRVEAVQKIYDELLGQLYQEQIAEASEMGSADVVDPAQPPLSPDGSGRRIPMIAAAVGLLVGIAGASIQEHFSSGIRHTADVERATGLPVVGQIPRLKALASEPTADDPVGSEAFGILRTNLRFLRTEHPHVIVVTSSEPGEGKTTVAVNLALSMGRQGSRVLLVDGDLRKPKVHRLFHHPREPGLTDVLVGDHSLAEVIVNGGPPELPSTLTCGTRAKNPSELLGSAAFAKLVEDARTGYDYVIVDTPPALVVTDPLLVADVADGLLVVAVANKTSRYALQRVVESLHRARAPILGVILNLVPSGGIYGRYGRYRNGYGYYPRYYHHDDGEDGEPRSAVSRLASRIKSLFT